MFVGNSRHETRRKELLTDGIIRHNIIVDIRKPDFTSTCYKMSKNKNISYDKKKVESQ